ncbi:MAG: 4Fe-4S dicluster domain-containing protein [Desulfobacterales bacterium]|nr:4Fe-4S dicluster domain-containing protein [Desulfobacterales bacterium]
MIFTISLYLSLGICILGLLYRLVSWFTLNTQLRGTHYGWVDRIKDASKAVIGSIFSVKCVNIIKTFIIEVVLQLHIIKNDPFRWIAHICIFLGFTLLLFMHAMEDIVSTALFSGYYSTVNPYLCLRNIFGLMTIVGIIMVVGRRYIQKKPLLKTNSRDTFAIVLLAIIFISGFLLEAVKIFSEPVFDQMVNDYGDPSATEDVEALKAYWATEFHVVFSDFNTSNISNEILETGKDVHIGSCADCHSKPTWAFISFPISKALSPAAPLLNKIRMDTWLWYIHFLACFIGLAYLPFSKFLHIVTAPLSLLIRSVADPKPENTANSETRRAIELDACTHCGTCSLNCSVAPVYQILNIPEILPSEKLSATKAIIKNQHDTEIINPDFQIASYVCTSCYRCTQVCSSGINLQDMWLTTKRSLHEKGIKDPYTVCRTTLVQKPDEKHLIPIDYHKVYRRIQDRFAYQYFHLTLRPETFTYCIQCQTCTNACPVMASAANNPNELLVSPQQIMNLMRMRLLHIAIRSPLVWDCLTCYKCQECCPQRIPITDIFYELKQLSVDLTFFDKANTNRLG